VTIRVAQVALTVLAALLAIGAAIWCCEVLS
jgi:hypothetical protein